MVEIQVDAVRQLQVSVNDSGLPLSWRSLEVRRFCDRHGRNLLGDIRRTGDTSLWAKVDTEHLLSISSNMPLLSNYLVERVVAAT